jgi:hypothetical protein
MRRGETHFRSSVGSATENPQVRKASIRFVYERAKRLAGTAGDAAERRKRIAELTITS